MKRSKPTQVPVAKVRPNLPTTVKRTSSSSRAMPDHARSALAAAARVRK